MYLGYLRLGHGKELGIHQCSLYIVTTRMVDSFYPTSAVFLMNDNNAERHLENINSAPGVYEKD